MLANCWEYPSLYCLAKTAPSFFFEPAFLDIDQPEWDWDTQLEKSTNRLDADTFRQIIDHCPRPGGNEAAKY
jgi:hypothetical protein